MTLKVELWIPKQIERKIVQIIPASGWSAHCWLAEADRHASRPLLAWALVAETDESGSTTQVVGLLAMGDQSDEESPVDPVFFADELSNFRFYHQDR